MVERSREMSVLRCDSWSMVHEVNVLTKLRGSVDNRKKAFRREVQFGRNNYEK